MSKAITDSEHPMSSYAAEVKRAYNVHPLFVRTSLVLLIGSEEENTVLLPPFDTVRHMLDVWIDGFTGTMQGYNAWPPAFTKGSSAFIGGVYDGVSMWMIPCDADRVVRIFTSDGRMQGYNAWPPGFTKGSWAFSGGVYDEVSVWMIPLNADRVVRIFTSDGAMQGYDAWPSGFTKGSSAFTGGVYDGVSVWMIPGDADRVVQIS